MASQEEEGTESLLKSCSHYEEQSEQEAKNNQVQTEIEDSCVIFANQNGNIEEAYENNKVYRRIFVYRSSFLLFILHCMGFWGFVLMIQRKVYFSTVFWGK